MAAFSPAELAADCRRAWELMDAQQSCGRSAGQRECEQALVTRAALVGLAHEQQEPDLHRFRGAHLTFFYEWMPRARVFMLGEACWMPDGEGVYITWQRGAASILMGIHEDRDGDVVTEEALFDNLRTRGQLAETVAAANLSPVFDRATRAGIALPFGFPGLLAMHREVCTMLFRADGDRIFE